MRILQENLPKHIQIFADINLIGSSPLRLPGDIKMQKISNAVDKHRSLILEAERYIWANPETGYKEFKTSKYMEDKFIELGSDKISPYNYTRR